VYPMPTMGYIQDYQNRIYVLTGQPLGVTSRRNSWIDVFLDRRLLQDDQRGLNQGVVDNRQTKEVFKVFFEATPFQATKPSLEAQLESQKLLSPPIIMYSTMKSTISELGFIHDPLPCNFHLLNFRRSTAGDFSLFLHRFGVSCEIKCANSSALQLSSNLAPGLVKALQPTVTKMSLSLLTEERQDIYMNEELFIDEMDFAVYNLRRKKN